MNTVFYSLFENGTAYFILSFAEPFFHTFILYYLMRKLMPNRLNIYVLIIIAILYALWFNIRTSELYGTNYHLIMNFLANGLTYFIVIFLFKGKLWKKLIVWWYFDLSHRIVC